MVSTSLVPELVLTLIASGASLTVFWVSIAVTALAVVIMTAEAIIDIRNFILHNLLDGNNGWAHTELYKTIVISSGLNVNNAISTMHTTGILPGRTYATH